MRDEIKALKVCGGNFVPETCLQLFHGVPSNQKKVAFSILYGRNGSGKSTIARAFRQISGVNDFGLTAAALCDEEGKEITLNDDEKQNIYVFDQKFIDENIKLEEEDGLNTIVMLGNQIEIDKTIKELKQTISSQKATLDEQEKEFALYLDNNNELSPDHHFDNMKEALRGSSNWGGRDRDIDGKRAISTFVTDETYKKFICLNPDRSRDELIVDYYDKYNKLCEFRTGAQFIREEVPRSHGTYNIKHISDLLKRKIEKPKLNVRDKLLLDILLSRDASFLHDIQSTFSNKETEYCPFCMKPISKEEKEELVLGVERVLTEIAKEHQTELEDCKLKSVNLNLSPFNKLDDSFQQCNEAIAKFNNEIERVNTLLARKIENPYSPIEISLLRFNFFYDEMKRSLSDLEAARIEHNRSVTDLDPIKAELRKINDDIAYYDIYDHHQKYRKQIAEKNKAEKALNEIKEQYRKNKEELAKLEAQKKSVNIAVDIINRALNYIFFSNDRLKIKYNDGKYQLLVNGRHVKPCEISTGETNAIALCYFFSMIGENKSMNDVHSKSYLIVIDDPITSFDFENKVGTLSYIKSQMLEFLCGNKSTKFLVMTHDLMTFSHLLKIAEELREKLAWSSLGSRKFSLIANYYKLANRKLDRIDSEHEEYSNLFKTIYKYAKASEDEPSNGIGNIMRQLLEAFAAFEFKVKFEDLARKEYILNKLEEPFREHFENLMYRLVLNGESHRRYQIKYGPPSVLQPMYSFEEKQRTAKETLCLLYLLNREHVLAHLGNGENTPDTRQIEKDIKRWCEEIKGQGVSAL